MTSQWNDDRSDSEIQRFEGRPNSPTRPDESTRWQRFLQWICPWLRHSAEVAIDLTERYAEAEVNAVESGAERSAQEAAELAIKNDEARQKGVKAFCDVVNLVFPNDPEAAESFKLAKLLANNPEILEQMENVIAIRERLRIRHATHIQIVPGELPKIAAAGESDAPPPH